MRQQILYISLCCLVSAASGQVQASQLDLLRCVQELKNIRAEDAASLEYQAGLVIGSAARVSMNPAQTAGTNLLIANERGVYAFALVPGRLNALQLEIPHPDPRRKPRLLFLTYAQSEIYGSRLLTIDWDLPPQGRAPSQFKATAAMRATMAQNERQLGQLIAEELKHLAELYSQGLLAKADLLAGNLSLCRKLGLEDKKLAEWMNHQIGELELVSSEQPIAVRAPASTFP